MRIFWSICLRLSVCKRKINWPDQTPLFCVSMFSFSLHLKWAKKDFCLFCISPFPANIYLFRLDNRNATKKCEICSKLIIKTLKRRKWRLCGDYIVNFEHISFFSSVSIVDFEHVFVWWVFLPNKVIYELKFYTLLAWWNKYASSTSPF